MYSFRTKVVIVSETHATWERGGQVSSVDSEIQDDDLRKLLDGMHNASTAIWLGTQSQVILSPVYVCTPAIVDRVCEGSGGLMYPNLFDEDTGFHLDGAGHEYDWIIYYWSSSHVRPVGATTGAQHLSTTKDYGLTWFPAIAPDVGVWDLGGVLVHEWLHLFTDCLHQRTGIPLANLPDPHDDPDVLSQKLGRRVDGAATPREAVEISGRIAKTLGIDPVWTNIAYRRNFIRRFLLCGPFPLDHTVEPSNLTPKPGDTLDGREWFEFSSSHVVTKGHWCDSCSFQSAFRSAGTFGKKLYASTRLHSSADMQATLRVGGNGPIDVWLNGHSVLRLKDDNSTAFLYDRETVTIRLHCGENALLIAVGQTKCRWNFWLELMDEHGRSLDTVESRVF